MREKILKELNKNEYISGQKIAEKFKISRTAVLKNVNALRKLGFKIKSTRRKGYKLISYSKKLNTLTVNKNLKTSFIGQPILYFENVASTINQIMLRAKKSDEGLVVIAQRQEKGRGRFKRQWSSRKGGIWCSLLLKPKAAPAEAPLLNMIASLAIAKTIEDQTFLKASIKWPNDIKVNKKKVAGILTQMVAELDVINFVVLSFGINVNNSLPKSLQKTAVNLKNAAGEPLDIVKFFLSLLKNIEGYYTHWQNNGFDLILEEWKKRCETLGKNVKVKGVSGALTGKALNVDEFGRLILETKDGKKHYLSTGEVQRIGS